ncbi:MAG: cytochrome c [Proteobacteria bacterium]|nr:cytochrome c [Pseudomonadota bacterium]
MNILQNWHKIPYLGVGITVITFIGLQAGVVIAAESVNAPEPITYSGHVARIINENCVVCHREGGIGPMQLTNFEQVRPWAPLIQLKVANREMPPYAYDHDIGLQDLQADWRLAQDDIDTIVAWVDQGSALGDLEQLPPPPILRDVDEWNFAAQFGQPDLVLASKPIDIPANGNDLWDKHFIDGGLTENRCIKALQVKPRGDAKSVVHHANTYFAEIAEDGSVDRKPVTEYAMGKWGEVIPEGVCRTAFAGTKIQWDIHMYPGGLGGIAPNAIIEDNVVELGIWLHPKGYAAKVTQDLKTYQLDQGDLFIPPHGTAMTQGFHSFDHPVRIDSFQPHGHLRMNAASLEIFYPATGKTEVISMISNWSATWHHSHLYDTDIAPLLPVGAILITKQWYDNTAANPNNPDPRQWVGWGQRTSDEMSHSWIAISHLDDETYQEILEQRESENPSGQATD